MKFKALLILSILLFIASCSSDDDKNESLNGTWKLKNATVVEGASFNYDNNEVEWTFNQKLGKLTVTNTIMSQGPENIFSGLPSGIYTFTVNTSGSTKTLYVEGNKQGEYAITTANLVITNAPQAQNGLTKVFSR